MTVFVLWAMLASGVAAQLPVDIPEPTGQFAVGTRRFEWVDSSRAEIAELFRRDSSGAPQAVSPSGMRRVAVQAWYPTIGPSSPRAAYNPSADAFVGVIRDTTRLRRYAELTGRAVLDAPVRTDERFPLVVFSPGGSMFISDYTVLLEDLASHGYIVVAVGHPGTSLVAFADGTFGIESAWRPPQTLSRSLEVDSLRHSWNFFRSRDAYLANDLRFVAGRVANPQWTPLASSVDGSRIGFVGHSTGGSIVTTASAGWNRASRRAVVVYDVILPGVMFEHPITIPFMLFRTTARNYPAGWTDRLLSVFDHVRSDGYDVLVDGATHQGFSDRVFLAAGDSSTRADALQQLVTTSAYTRTFFDRYLKDGAALQLADSASATQRGVSITRHRP